MSYKDAISNRWKEFKVDPLWHAFVEVFLTVMMTFLPLLLLSTPIMKGGDNLSSGTIIDNFSAYLNSGEIVLPILSICGTILAILGLHSRKFKSPWIVASIIIAAFMLLTSGYILGTNRGFSGELNKDIFIGLILVYIFAIIFWFFMAWKSHREDESRENPEERANKLLKQMHQQKATGKL